MDGGLRGEVSSRQTIFDSTDDKDDVYGACGNHGQARAPVAHFSEMNNTSFIKFPSDYASLPGNRSKSALLTRARSLARNCLLFDLSKAEAGWSW